MDPAIATFDFAKAGAIIADMIESYLAGGAPPSNPEGADHDDRQDCRSTSVATSLHLHSSVDDGPSPLQPGEHRAPVQSGEQGAGSRLEPAADPRLIQNEIERRLAAAREADPTKRREEGLRRDVVRIRKSIDRLLTAYQEGLLPIEELRERMPQLRRRQQASNAELQAIADQSVTRTAYLRLAETLNTFLTRLRSSASALDVSERQRIVRLLVKEVLVGDDKIIIRHCIPLPNRSDDGDGPSTARINAAPAGTEGYLLRSRSHLAVARQYLPVLRARPVRRALATARGCGRRDHRALCRRLHRRFRARGRRSAVPGPAARADGEVRAGASP